jgi:hypothetical protein
VVCPKWKRSIRSRLGGLESRASTGDVGALAWAGSHAVKCDDGENESAVVTDNVVGIERGDQVRETRGAQTRASIAVEFSNLMRSSTRPNIGSSQSPNEHVRTRLKPWFLQRTRETVNPTSSRARRLQMTIRRKMPALPGDFRGFRYGA